MGEKGKKARAFFEQGYNCCQSVAAAYAEEMGLEQTEALRLASAFGGGFGRLREVCGTVSGMAMVLGAVEGYVRPEDREGKKLLYARMQELAGKFRAENGSIVCRDLLGTDGASTDPNPSQRTQEYYARRPCAELVEYAADLLESQLFSPSEGEQDV